MRTSMHISMRACMHIPSELGRRATIRRHFATHCITLQRTTTRCNTLQHTAIHCITLQRTISHCNTYLASLGKEARSDQTLHTLQRTATHTEHARTKSHDPTTLCNALQHTATHCNALQHTATHCNALHHAAMHCNTYLASSGEEPLLNCRSLLQNIVSFIGLFCKKDL